MTHRAKLPFIAAGLLLATLAGTTLHAQEFDLSPAQAGRVHAQPNPEAIALLSPDFQWAKPDTLTVAVSVGEPPLAAFADDSTTIIGADPDVALLIGEALGKKVELVSVAWADWPLGVVSGKYDAVISNVTVTEERKERLDFSTYRKDVLGWYVKSDSPITQIKEPKDIAGLKVITGAGTNQEKILLEWDRQNVAAGLAPVEVQYYDDSAAAQLAIQSGRADAQFNPNSSLAYASAVNGGTKLVGTLSGGWPVNADIAVTTRKDAGIAAAITAAINGLIKDGTYGEALKRWNLSAESIDVSATNPPGLPRT
ncbi:MAG: bacterial extracellular solute-binding s, 3 family protein [Devosia sp.]|uniref:ABC transporter substrate-binding protein n=1 Tax=Devosia sp. TaxID=1871048 RepID=UPI0026126A5F|nr:ABC transporter substrate-binding protein [Devosia sp.]MDB5586112.1 bacterial extracellular solute-binding s, 3 family protein [Devosia sp.]